MCVVKKEPSDLTLGILQGRSPEEAYNAEFAWSYFQDIHVYTEDNRYPPWVTEVLPPPDDNSLTLFTPGNIKNLMKNRSSNSSPGDNDISYYHLKNLDVLNTPLLGHPVL